MSSPPISQFFYQVKDQIKHFSNIVGILEKLEMDQHMTTLGGLFSEIIQKEKSFAFKGSLNRVTEDEVYFSDNGYQGTVAHKLSNF